MIISSYYKNPDWWTDDNDSDWDRVKEAFRRDWDQTHHDLRGNSRDTPQTVGKTVKQAAGSESIPPRGEPVYERAEAAYRFGHGARSHYGDAYAHWNAELERELKRDWHELHPDRQWELDVLEIHKGWEHEED